MKTETNPMETLFRQTPLTPIKVGDIIEGRVISREGNRIYIDLGNFRTGLIYGREFYIAKTIAKNMEPGQTVSVKVMELENDEGFTELSLAQASLNTSWQKIMELQEQRLKLKLKIEEANRGGLIGVIEGQKAFLPVSQLSFQHYPRVEEADKDKILSELQKFVGTEMEVRIIAADPEHNKLIISEKAAQDELVNELISQFKVGDVIEGEVSGVTEFGAFVKFSPEQGKGLPLEGLIHISELDWQLIEDPHDIVKVGQTVKAKVIAVENGRISLSLKALKKDSWEGVEEKLKPGDMVQGTLMKFNTFGAFIKIDENIHGLCHISEFGSEKTMKEMIEPDKQYKFKVLSIEPKEHRLSLSFIDKPEKTETKTQEPEALKTE